MVKPPLNYTTSIPATRSVGECQTMLGAAGASAVAVTFDEGRPVGLTFRLDTGHGPRDFALPVNIGGVHKVLMRADYPGRVGGQALSRLMSNEHAARVAWRIAKDWLEAQLAIIAAGMVSLDEVMLPYLQVEGGGTLYAAYLENERRALEAGGA